MSSGVGWRGTLGVGSLLGREFPRVVQIDGFRLDAQPTGIILVMESADVPGVVGRVDTLLGKHNVNNAQWRMGQTASYNQGRTPSINISFINLDTPISPEILDELIQLEKVYSVRQVIL